MNRVGAEGRTPLHVVSMRGDLKAMRLLLSSGVGVDETNNLGWTPLHRTLRRGYNECAKRLLEAGALVNQANASGWTPLHWACRDGRIESVRQLLSAGAAADQGNTDGLMPLHFARRHGHFEFAELLGSSVSDLIRQGSAYVETQDEPQLDSAAALEAAQQQHDASLAADSGGWLGVSSRCCGGWQQVARPELAAAAVWLGCKRLQLADPAARCTPLERLRRLAQ